VISVIIPSYNRAATLPMAIESVLGQTYRDIELIIVDDGSTDGTEGLIRSITDSRLRYIKLEKNGGACRARNIGIDAARGEHIAFQDSDDRWRYDKLERQLRFLQETGADVAYCAIERYGVDSQVSVRFPAAPIDNSAPKEIRFRKLLEQNTLAMVTVICKAECARAVRFDESLPRRQDWDWALRVFPQYEVQYQDEVLVDSFAQEDSVSFCSAKHPVALEIIYGKHQKTIESDRTLTAQWMCDMANARFRAGLRCAPDCFKAFRVSRDYKFLAKGLICAFGLQTLYHKTNAERKGKR